MQPYILHNGKKPSAAALIAKRLSGKNAEILRRHTIEERRETQRFLFSKLAMPKNISNQLVFCSGVHCEWLWNNEHKLEHKVVLYLHGGGWVFGGLKSARVAGMMMAEKLNCRVLSVDYRLAPENPFPAGLDDAHDVYCWLLESGFDSKEIAFLGDSAGGNLALALTHRLIEEQRPLPACIALISPATDLRADSVAIAQNCDLLYTIHRGLDTDVFALYVPDEIDRENPLVSPVCGLLTGFPPILIHTGGDEELAEENLVFAEKAYRDGVNITLKLWEDLFHDFTLGNPIFPEAQESATELADFLRENLWSE